MTDAPWIEPAARWIVTYAAHSAILALVGLTLACALFRPGARRATALKVALLGALLSASLPWKVVEPLGLLPGPSVQAMALGPVAQKTALTPPTVPSAVEGASAGPSLIPAAPSKAPAAPVPPATVVLLLLASAAFAGTTLGLIRLSRSRVTFARGLRARPLMDAEADETLQRWTRADRRAPVALTASDNLRCPVVLSAREICVPKGLWQSLSIADREAALAHEYAHIERRDPLWFIATAVLERAFFFLPWHRALRQRWVDAAEFACDRRAAERVGSDTQVARCLSSVAAWSVQSAADRAHVPTTVAAMAAAPSELVERVKVVLNAEAPPTSGRFRIACVTALAAFACAAPGMGPREEEPQEPADITVKIVSDGKFQMSRGDQHPPLPPIVTSLRGREAQVAATEWLAHAVQDFPMTTMEGSGVEFRSGTVCIEASQSTLMRDVQHLMARCGHLDVSIPDVRILLNGETYRTPLPVDLSITPGSAAKLPGIRAEIRLDRAPDAEGGVRYRISRGIATLPGVEFVPAEEEEGEERSIPVVEAPPAEFNSIASVAAWIDALKAPGRVRQATLDPRKKVTVGEVAAVLEVLRERGVTDVTFMGSYEQ